MIKAVIFDLWETLGTKNVGVSNSLREKFGIEKTPDFMKKYETAVQLVPWKTQEEMATNFLKSFSLPMSDENSKFITDLFNQAIVKATLYPGMNDLLVELGKKYKLGLLSNTTVFESVVPQNWGIDNFFEAKVFSWQINSLKPAKKNFDAICSKLGVSLEESVFIDDGEKNVQAAKDLGVRGYTFTGVEALKRDLKQDNLI